MPEVHVYLAEGRSVEQKKKLMKALSDAVGFDHRRRCQCHDRADHGSTQYRQDEGWRDIRRARSGEEVAERYSRAGHFKSLSIRLSVPKVPIVS